MSDSESIDEAFARMFLEARAAGAGRAATRREREARAFAQAKGRKKKTETKTAQLNVRVTPSFKKRLTALAAKRGVSVVEMIEIAVEQIGG